MPRRDVARLATGHGTGDDAIKCPLPACAVGPTAGIMHSRYVVGFGWYLMPLLPTRPPIFSRTLNFFRTLDFFQIRKFHQGPHPAQTLPGPNP